MSDAGVAKQPAPRKSELPGRASNRFLYLLVFVVGISTLGAEIAAARLMAPFFGASTIVWANTIAIVLVALSIGYWFGGRLADQGAAGNVMMIWTGAITLGLFTWLFLRAADRSAEKQDLIELAEARGVELDPARAARAVAAGQGERLRQRITDGST